MKKLLAMLLALLLCTPACAETGAADAEQFMQWLAAGEYAAVCENMTGDVRAALPEEALAATLAQLGTIETWDAPVTAVQAPYTISDFPVRQGGMNYIYRIVLDESGLLACLQVLPGQPETAAPAETAVGVHTETVLLRPGEADETEAILTLPEAAGPVPAVILLHGSGPNDRDESVYGMKVFRDIAEALAQHGIASIRYDKYTRAHADRIGPDFTPALEYIPDAAAALAALENDPRIGDIFIVGHSQGGMMMPRVIAALDSGRIAGGIAIAGTPLPMWRIQYAQNMAIIDTLSGDEKTAAQAIVDAEMAKLDQLPEWTEEALQQNTFFGVSAYYQLDDIHHSPAEIAAGLDIPLLMLQGAADWQVTLADGIEAWREVLPEADYAVLPGITHMLNRVETPTGTTADYSGSVDAAVTDAIAGWIHNISQ